jgi:hypothetical protein
MTSENDTVTLTYIIICQLRRMFHSNLIENLNPDEESLRTKEDNV